MNLDQQTEAERVAWWNREIAALWQRALAAGVVRPEHDGVLCSFEFRGSEKPYVELDRRDTSLPIVLFNVKIAPSPEVWDLVGAGVKRIES